MTYAVDPGWFRYRIVRVALESLRLWSPAAEVLVTGTALQESGLRSLHQAGGPALGWFQMEPATCDDVWRWLHTPAGSGHLAGLTPLLIGDAEIDERDELVGNAWYAAAMCRLKYAMASEPLPELAAAEPTSAEIRALGAYYKQHYNTPAGAATVDEFQANWVNTFGSRLVVVPRSSGAAPA